MTALVAAAGLSVRYGGVQALAPLTFEIPEGSWALLGPNGAGKSTLIRTLMGLTAASRGTCFVMGERPDRNPAWVRKRVGYMPESPAIVHGLTGIQYVRLAARLNGLEPSEARRQAHVALDEVGLGEARYRPVDSYSTGMRQRAKLAQAIVHDPKLLILDEPTNGLDAEGRDAMLDLIQRLAKRGHSLLMSSHILGEVRKVCDNAVILRKGQVVHQGPLKALRTDLGGFEVDPFDNPKPFIELVRAEGYEVEPHGERLIVRGAPDLPSLLRLAGRAGVAMRGAKPHRKDVNDSVVDMIEGNWEVV